MRSLKNKRTKNHKAISYFIKILRLGSRLMLHIAVKNLSCLCKNTKILEKMITLFFSQKLHKKLRINHVWSVNGTFLIVATQYL